MSEEIKIVEEREITDNTIEQEMSGVGEVFQITDVVKRIAIPKSSVRIASSGSVKKNGCVLPPYNPAEILRYKKLDATFQTCIEIKVDTSVGLGYTFGYKDIDNHKEILDFFKTPNTNFNNTFSSILKSMFRDLELFHNGYLEFAKSGDLRSLYYLPAKDMYIKPKSTSKGTFTREVDKYCYIPSDTAIPNELTPYPIDGETRDGVHYCLHFKRDSQEDLYYGKPDNDHLFDLIRQSYLSDQYNINFFSNGGQPSWAVLITGGKLSKKSYEKIKEFIDNNLKGVANAHKMLFLSVPNEKAQIKLIPLSKAIDEQFITLSEKTQFRIALKCRVHPKLLGLSSGGNFGGGFAGISDLKLFIETVSQPIQNELIQAINKFLELEFKVNCEFDLKCMNISNEKDDAVMANIYWNMVDEFGNRAITINEIRQMYLKLKPIDMINTKENEKVTEEDGSLKITPTIDGDMRTSNGTNLDIGDGESASNLEPDKNNDSKK